jgi:proline dehydrogenase
MNLTRRALLAASQSHWLRERAPKYSFVRRNVSRFMPGESVEEAFAALQQLATQNIGAVLTALGENVTDRREATAETDHYCQVLKEMTIRNLNAEISVKLTHLGLDLDNAFCYANLEKLIAQSPPDKTVWIDMEQSPYVDRTLAIFTRARRAKANVGVCIQAYLRRTESDLRSLLPLGGAIRLVKGAYNETAEVAFPKKRDVDENYFHLAKTLLGQDARFENIRAAIATHDRTLTQRITAFATANQFPKEKLEFQMLYGIQRAEQQRLAKQGHRSIVLIAYGTHWFPWYMRRLAERPANVLFLLRNLFAK